MSFGFPLQRNLYNVAVVKKKQVLDRQTSGLLWCSGQTRSQMGKPGFVCIDSKNTGFGLVCIYRYRWRMQGAVGSGPVLQHYWVGEEDRRKLVLSCQERNVKEEPMVRRGKITDTSIVHTQSLTQFGKSSLPQLSPLHCWHSHC